MEGVRSAPEQKVVSSNLTGRTTHQNPVRRPSQRILNHHENVVARLNDEIIKRWVAEGLLLQPKTDQAQELACWFVDCSSVQSSSRTCLLGNLAAEKFCASHPFSAPIRKCVNPTGSLRKRVGPEQHDIG